MGCAIRCTPGALSNLRVLGVFLVAFWVVSAANLVWAEAEVYLADGVTILNEATPALTQERLPVLFVHGHNLMSSDDADFNFRKNWQQSPSGLTSFKETLNRNENAWLDIEPYYIRFQDQHRSIVDDASEIAWAVENILHRHDGSHIPFTSNPSTSVKVAIIAYSKGTISSRLYLKSLHEQQYDLPAPRPGFNPVSTFIAIAPPNHGMSLNLGALAVALADPSILSSLALKQLNNGYKHDCSQYLLHRTESQHFIKNLNWHDIEDSQPPSPPDPNWSLGEYDAEARGSRSNSSPTSTGTLYVNLYANSDANGVARDSVGGHYPSNDCQGRVLAKNLAPDAENIEVSAIPGQDPTTVHINTVHTPRVICLALYTVVHHRVPNDPDIFGCVNIGEIPIIPEAPGAIPWWWWIILMLVAAGLIFVYWVRGRMARLRT